MAINLDVDDRGRTPSLPPAELIEQPDIRKAAEAHDKAKLAAQAARRSAIQLEQTRPQAEASDRELYADAIEAEKPDPGTPATDARREADRRTAPRRKRASSSLSARSTRCAT